MSELTGPGVRANASAAAACTYGRTTSARNHRPRHRRGASRGSYGELVITPLFKEALPLLRYRTGDITKLDSSPAPAAAPTSAWINSGAQRRHDDHQGRQRLPVADRKRAAGRRARRAALPLVLRPKTLPRHLEVQIELADAGLLEDYGKLQSLRDDIQNRLKSILASRRPSRSSIRTPSSGFRARPNASSTCATHPNNKTQPVRRKD